MDFDINNFVIDRVLRGSMVSPNTGDVLWSITQVTDPSLKCSGTTVDAVDAVGSPIMQFNRDKKAEFSASNSLFDLGLAAAQFGGSKNIASAQNKIVTPKFEYITTEQGKTTATLKEVPIGTEGAEIKQIYAVNPNQSLGVRYVVATTASATEFKIVAATKTLTLPTGLASGTILLVRYNYEATGAVEVANSGTSFPTGGEFYLEVIGADACDSATKYFAYVIMPNAKLTSNVDLTFSTDGKHPFTLTALQNYCDPEKLLFKIIIPEA